MSGNSVKITDDLIKIMVRGVVQSDGLKADKISKKLEEFIPKLKFSVVILKSISGYAWSARNTIEISLTGATIFVFKDENNACVDRVKMKEWLDKEYGWMTGFAGLPKFRDNMVDGMRKKFGCSYQVLLFPRINCIDYSVGGIKWDASDLITSVVICDQ